MEFKNLVAYDYRGIFFVECFKFSVHTRDLPVFQVFLDFVLQHYITVGVTELDPEKLTPLLLLKYHNSLADAVADLGGHPEEINKAFVGFQKFLYQETVAA